MTRKLPQKGYLYTWNFVDGFLGLPKRKIKLKDMKPHLLHVAYLGGGERWDDKDTPSGALFYMILTASPRRQQSTENYHKCYENYNIEGIKKTFDAEVEELSGGSCPWWQICFNCQDWSSEKIDAKIEEVLKWHDKEIDRIKQIEY